MGSGWCLGGGGWAISVGYFVSTEHYLVNFLNAEHFTFVFRAAQLT